MKKYLLSIVLLISALGMVSGSALAAPIVVDGSSYSIYLQGSGDPFVGEAMFDNQAASAPYQNLTLTLSESETALAGGASQIMINLSADGILFPSNDEPVLLGIGVDGNGLDLSIQVTLEEAYIIFRNSANDIVSMSENLASQVPRNSPWDGFFPEAGSAFADNLGGLGVSGISFDFRVREIQNDVPEPASLLLAGIGLLGLTTARRKKL